jgi:[histone H3]-lysine36 N-dimethyltransferase SETMAR
MTLRRHSNKTKMAAPLTLCTKEEQRSVIRFLWSEGIKCTEIHRRMLEQYGASCLSLQQIYEWSKKFQGGTTSISDAPRPGQANRAVTPDSIQATEKIILDNRRISVDEVAAELSISHGSAHFIIHEVLKFNKVSARWVPRMLTPAMKEARFNACNQLLARYNLEGDAFLQRIVTGDESWVHYYEPETKRTSKQWRHVTSPKPRKFRVQSSEGKVLLTLFWDHRGPILEHYIPKGTTVTSGTYCDLLQNHLKPAI